MADTGYSPLQTVSPDDAPPSDYQTSQPRAAQGLQQLGEGAAQAGQFFDQVASDNAFNDYQDKATKLLRGDPNKTVMGPDGQPVPDTGYYGLQGRAALDARPQVQQQLDTLAQQTRDQLSSQTQVAAFETYSRRYRANAEMDIGSHADTEAKKWYGQVNSTSAKNALDAIAANPLDSSNLLNNASELTNAYTKQAMIEGAQPGDPVFQDAIRRARVDAVKTQIVAVGAQDPSRALQMTDKAQGLLGADYAQIRDTLRARADEADANTLASSAMNAAQPHIAATAAATSPSQPVYQQASTQIPGGMTADGLAHTVQIESGGRDVTNASGHVGYGQFSDATWKEYGAGGNPHDLGDSVAGIQRYAAANARYLAPRIGRQPTDAELYIAHQQGPGGALALLTNPNANAARLVGQSAITGNGGTTSMTAAQFVAMWTHKFNGTTPSSGVVPEGPRSVINTAPVGAPQQSVPAGGIPASPDMVGANSAVAVPVPTVPDASNDNTPQDPKAVGYQAIDASDASDEVKQRARTMLTQQLQAQAIAAESTATQKKQASDKAANTYMTQMLTPGTDIASLLPQIASDPDLEWQTKEQLTNAAQAHAENSAAGASAVYGSGFGSAYQQVTAPAGDPSRIADAGTILRRAGPGGDLTLAGAEKLITVMGQNAKSVDDASVNAIKSSLMSYARSKISNDTSGLPQIPGVPAHIDAQGEMIYQSRFVPQFLKGYDAWVASGKSPDDYLTKENVDKMAANLRSPREKAMQQMMATEAGVDVASLPDPPVPAPQGVDPDNWKVLAYAAPKVGNTQWPIDRWTAAVAKLRSVGTPAAMQQFDQKFAASGITAQEVLDIVGRPAQQSAPTAGENYLPAPAPASSAPADAASAPSAAPAPAPAQTAEQKAAADKDMADKAKTLAQLTEKLASDGELSPSDAKQYLSLHREIQPATVQAPIAPPGYFTERTNHGWEIVKLPTPQSEAIPASTTANALDQIAARSEKSGELSEDDAAAYWALKNSGYQAPEQSSAPAAPPGYTVIRTGQRWVTVKLPAEKK